MSAMPVMSVVRALAAAAVLGGCASAGAHPARLAPVADLRHAIDSLVSAPEYRNAHWGVLVIDPATGDTLYSHEAGKLFMPASNMKIVTGAVALARLGPDYEFRTTLLATGPLRDGVLLGDLLVEGRGDPSFSDQMRGDAMAPMRELADSLVARGIHRIQGRVLPEGDAFPGPTLGFGWSWDDLDADYGAGVDELFFNDGVAGVLVRGTDDSALIETRPARRYPPVVRGALAAARAGDGVGVQLVLDSVRKVFVASGATARGRVDSFTVVFPDQRAAFLAALEEALVGRGITVGDAVLPPSLARDTLMVYRGLPLRDVLKAMEKPSQNQIAELLFHALGLEGTGVGNADSARAVIARQLVAWGAEPDGFVLRDGSGLSRYDYLSPETIVHVLAAIQRDTAFAAFYDALPIAGVDGTIDTRMKGTPAEGNVHAKTGFIANARSLSGYVTTRDGRRLIFSALCNNWTVPVKDVERVQDAIAVRLAALDTRGAR